MARAAHVEHADGRERRDLYRFNGGQGTTNVNGWAPDSRRFQYSDCAGSSSPRWSSLG